MLGFGSLRDLVEWSFQVELNLGGKMVVGADPPLVGFVVESPYLAAYLAVGLEKQGSVD